MRNPFRSSSVHIPLFVVVYLVLLGIPMAISFLSKPYLMKLFGYEWWQVPLWTALTCALIAPFVYVSLQRQAQQQIMERQRQFQQILIQATQGMTLIKEMQRLLDLIIHILTRAVGVEHASLWLLDESERQFTMQAARGAHNLSGNPVMETSQPLVQYLMLQKEPILREHLKDALVNGRSKYLLPVVDDMNRLEAAVIIPSIVGKKLLGFVAMSQKKSGQPYSPEDLEIFEVMANQAALAIENAQFYEQLQRTQADLFQTAKMASLGYMAGGMSHQINNRFHVLTILAGTMKSVLKDMDPATVEAERLKGLWEKMLETFTKIEQNALQGGDIVKTLLRFSRPAKEYRVVSVSEILATAREIAQFRVNFSTIDLIQEVPEGLPLINGDLNQLADGLFNLLSNAFDAIQKKEELIQANQLPKGPKDPSPFKGKIYLRVWSEPRDGKPEVGLEFQDNGIGMTPQQLENLFVPFFTTKASSQKGTGLGLYVIHRIIEQHGGKITASSTYGVGSTLTITLPASAEAGAPVA